jgi:hypothetical protein
LTEPSSEAAIRELTARAVAEPSEIERVLGMPRAGTGAIHVYGGDFFAIPRSAWCPDTGVERPFDVEHARRVFAEANARWQARTPPALER